MVHLSKCFYGASRQYRRKHFLDSLHINVRGGSGGMGFPKYGGVGGKGGDVYVEAEETTLKMTFQNHPNKRVVAGTGENSKSYKILGSPGTDVTIKAPIGVTVMNDNKRILGDLNKVNDRLLVARGGVGGSPRNQFMGVRGESVNITLDLKLIADVGFVGFPNAGKSTLLKALSRATPKIASYPFTTIEPNIGVMEYEDFRQITLADLPGLIEGAHLNYGLGHRFLKHVVRTKLLLFVVDISGFQLNHQSPHRTPFETIMLLNKELELYKDDLTSKPAILAVTKQDLEGAEENFQKLLDEIKDIEVLKENFPEELLPEQLVSFDDIIPICAKNTQNIDLLKLRIRRLLDFHADKRHGDALTIVDTKDDLHSPQKILV